MEAPARARAAALGVREPERLAAVRWADWVKCGRTKFSVWVERTWECVIRRRPGSVRVPHRARLEAIGWWSAGVGAHVLPARRAVAAFWAVEPRRQRCVPRRRRGHLVATTSARLRVRTGIKLGLARRIAGESSPARGGDVRRDLYPITRPQPPAAGSERHRASSVKASCSPPWYMRPVQPRQFRTSSRWSGPQPSSGNRRSTPVARRSFLRQHAPARIASREESG